MACSKCGKKGHRAPNCPDQPRDYAFQGRIDGLTEAQAVRIDQEFQKSKRKIAPESVGTSVKDKSINIPGLIGAAHRKLLGYKD